MTPDPPVSEISSALQELTTTVTERVRRLEAQVARQAAGRPGGFAPDDQGPRDPLSRHQRRPLGGMELGRDDSYAAWSAAHGVGRVLDPDEFSLGRLVRCMIAGDRNHLSELERQAVVEGTDAGGGILIPEQLAPTVLDLVRARTAVVEAGATVVPMGSDAAVWARIATGATPEWKAEMAPMGESAITFSAMRLNAHTLRTKIVISQEWIEDSPPAGEAVLERELISAFALEVDRAALYGSGVGAEPLGLKLTPGVNVEDAVALTSYSPLSRAIAAVRAANHEPNAIVESAIAAGTLDELVAGTDGQPLLPSPSVRAMPVFVTNLVGGAAGEAGDIFVGEWPNLVIGVRPSIQVRIKQVESRLAEDFAVELVAWLRADIGVVDATAFQVLEIAP